MEELLLLFETDSFIAIMGVVLGIFLGDIMRWWESRRQDRRGRDSIRKELEAIKHQIPQKRDILQKMINELNNEMILSGRCAKFMRLAYTHFMPQVHITLTTAQRNCLHIIHEKANTIEFTMDAHETSMSEALTGRPMKDPFGHHKNLLSDMIYALEVMEELIGSYMSGKPKDPFYTKEGGFDAVVLHKAINNY